VTKVKEVIESLLQVWTVDNVEVCPLWVARDLTLLPDLNKQLAELILI
jgi:hypothetical protein